MKTTKHKPKKTSAPKPSARGSKATPPKKPAAKTIDKKPSKKGASKKAETPKPSASAVEVKPAAPPVQPTSLAAPKPAPRVDDGEGDDAESVPGEAINGTHLARCIRFAAKVTPKEDGEVYFAHDSDGRPLISGHDLRRSHTGFLVEKAAMGCNIAVPREDACELAKMLEGLSGPMVRIDERGRVTIHHGVAQPPARFLLGERAITQTWEPPSQSGRLPAKGPLRISASAQAAAVRWPDAVVHEFQSSDGIAWFNVSDAETGVLLARAVLAQDGKDIFAEDQRQTEIPGSRTAGKADGASKLPPVTVLPPVEKQPELFDTAPAAPREGAVTIEAGGEAITIEADAKPAGPPVEGAPEPPAEAQADTVAWPEPDEKPVVVVIPEAIWDDLSPESLEALHIPPGTETRASWFTNPDHTASATLVADVARAVGRVLAELGLVCEDLSAGRRYGIECSLWTVGRAGEKGAAQ